MHLYGWQDRKIREEQSWDARSIRNREIDWPMQSPGLNYIWTHNLNVYKKRTNLRDLCFGWCDRMYLCSLTWSCRVLWARIPSINSAKHIKYKKIKTVLHTFELWWQLTVHLECEWHFDQFKKTRKHFYNYGFGIKKIDIHV